MADVDASLLYFCRLVKKHNKVALTGECADEIFGGYPWFHSEKAFEADIFPWSINLDFKLQVFSEELIKKLKVKEYVKEKYAASVKETPVLDTDTEKEKRRREISFLNIKWFMTTLLERMDRTSMYTGLEARVPFADHRIVEYIWNVPWEFKCPNGVVKGLLRDSCKDLLPKELLNRKKSPYPKTYNPKYEKLLIERLKEIMEDKNSPVIPLLNTKKIEDLIHSPSNYTQPWFGQLMAGPQLIAFIIQVNYWLKKYSLSI